MPRAYNKEACDTCRQRKVKCDEVRPVCGRCRIKGSFCTRTAIPPTFIHHDAPSLTIPPTPRAALAQPEIASVFHHYISVIAAWYDLGDSYRHFATSIPPLALDEPLLFSGLIAVAAMHISKTTGRKGPMAVASDYHSACVARLIGLDEGSVLLENGVALATVCLLRSYEIFDEDVDPNRHLQGAYSLASRQSLLGPSNTLLAAGFWNYLREDITFSLFEGCPLKMDLTNVEAPTADMVGLNHLSLVLGRIINATFTRAITVDEWHALMGATKAWYERLPAIERPYSRTEGALGELPRVWFIENGYASAMHYFLTACCILAVFASPPLIPFLPPAHYGGDIRGTTREGMLEAYAAEICAIAFTTRDTSVLINAFGPISYSARFIRDESVRLGVLGNLTGCRKVIGWPVARLMNGLKAEWTAY